jgi:hypothetical protein
VAKPFSIQAPEAIAKEYAGNKQRIAEAARMGVVDPTAAVLAGMFIDRMRGAQMQEGATPPTVAQEVMGGSTAVPSPTAGGLGLTPQAAPPMTPQMPMQGMPGMPTQGGMGEMAAQMPMGEGGPPMGMAEGGMTYAPTYTQGGLDGLPIPDTMFDESRNGGFNDGYAGGGIIAFNEGAAVPSAEEYFGRSVDPLKNRTFIESLMGKPQTKYADEEEAELLAERSPEARKKARNLDLGYALMAAGSKMASTPGGLFQSLGAGIGEAAPVLMQSAKERKAEERDIRKGLRDIEAGRNTREAQIAAAMLAASETAVRGKEGERTRDFTAEQAGLGREADINLKRMTIDADRANKEMEQSGAKERAIITAGGPEGKRPTPAQLNEQARQMTKRMTAAMERLDAAHEGKDYKTFQAAARDVASARKGYNAVMRKLGMPEMGALPASAYPNFASELAAANANRAAQRRPQASAASGGSNRIRFDAEGNRI